jgi:hypothetical protein
MVGVSHKVPICKDLLSPKFDLISMLGPCGGVTVNQLKAIVAVFGELSYLKIHTAEQYGLVGFVCRFVHS